MAWLKLCHTSIVPLSLRICQPCSTYDERVQRWLTQSAVNYYDVLGVKPSASQSQIKSAYYQLSKLYHPDTAKDVANAKENFAKLSVAYEVLGNPHKRALYDRKHNPSSFRHVGINDVEYRDFLRRRGTFSPRHSAGTTSARRPGTEFDEFYKQNYRNAMKYSQDVKKNSDYSRQRTRQNQTGGDDSALLGLILVSCAIAAFIFTK